jgi:hypothetical protein
MRFGFRPFVYGILLAAAVITAPGQSESWIIRFEDQFVYVRGVAANPAGGVYAVGEGRLTALNSPDTNAFLVSLDANGGVRWIRRLGSINDSIHLYSVAASPEGDVYIAGSRFAGDSFINVYLARYDATGVERWSRTWGHKTYWEEATCVVVDGNRLYIAGNATGSLPGNTALGEFDVFLSAWDTDGNHLWTRQFGSDRRDQAIALAVDSGGGIVVSGNVLGMLPGQPPQPPNPSGDLFLKRFNASGVELWTRLLRTESSGLVATDTIGGIYAPGQDSGDAVLQKYDLSGTEVWSRRFATGGYDSAFNVATAANGTVFVTGATAPIIDTGEGGTFVLRYTAGGELLPSWRFGARLLGCRIRISVSPAGVAYIAGGACIGRLGDNDLERNNPPVALCEHQAVVVDAGPSCSVPVSIARAPTPFDPDPSDRIVQHQMPPGPYGATPIPINVTLTATDNHSAQASCSGQIHVMDRTPPAIARITATPAVLWPPNHKMVSVRVNSSSTDNCGASMCSITGVISNQASGNAASDWMIVSNEEVQLRAERNGGSGRTYTIQVKCSDRAGNQTTGSTTVTAPANQAGR